MRKMRRIVTNPEIHNNSYMVHCQPFAWAAKLPMTGPTPGATKAGKTQTLNAMGKCFWVYISARVAPPVARTGDPKKAVMNRRSTRPENLEYQKATVRLDSSNLDRFVVLTSELELQQLEKRRRVPWAPSRKYFDRYSTKKLSGT